MIRNQTIRLSDYQPHPRNYNLHSDDQIRRLATSLSEFGQVRSIVVWRNTILAGHGVVSAALTLGWTDLRADVLPDSWPEQKALAYLVADNELARRSDPDQAQLAAILEELNRIEPLLVAAAGYNERELADLLRLVRPPEPVDAEPQIDRAEELRQKWQIESGQLWALGEHRLICGDCTDAETVVRVMDGEKPGAVVTDPPYAFGLSSWSNMDSKAGSWHDMMNNASWFADRYRQWSQLVVDGPIWVFSNWRTLPILMRAAFDSKVGLMSVMVWYKDWIGPGGQLGLRPTYELIGLSLVGDYGIPTRDVEDFVNVGWSSHKPSGHAAEKPVDLISHLIQVSAVDDVYDPFLGSGTTLIACENLGRRCFACEISPGYVAVCLERFYSATNKLPKLLETPVLEIA